MDSRFNKSLLVILSFSSLLLSSNAVPPTRISTSVPAPAPAPSVQYVDYILPKRKPNAGIGLFENSVPHKKQNSASVSPDDSVFQFGDPNFLGSIAEDIAKNADPEIVKLCVDAESPALCAATISSLLKGPFDPLKALEIEVDFTLKQAKSVAAIITALLKDPSTDKKAIKALDICQTQYNSMLDAINETVELLGQHNVVDSFYKFSSVISYKTTCEDAFVESPGVEIPFSQDSRTLFDLAGNCLGIMNTLVNNHKF